MLLLAERLHTVSQAFDQCRAARYKQSAQAGMYRRPQAGSGQSMQGKMSYGQEQVGVHAHVTPAVRWNR